MSIALSATASVEAIELPNHPFFVATAFQPQVGVSESHSLHPLIRALLTAGRSARTVPSKSASGG